MATLDQHRESLDPDVTLADALTGGRGDHVLVGEQSRHVVGYMKDFLFQPEQARTPLSRLSGGERGRLMLAQALARPSNVLLLDEPTNDLDLETLDVLEEMLGDYAGTVLLISHDRDFLDRLVNAVIVPEGDGRWVEYAGGYSDMLAQRGARPEPRSGRRPSCKAAKPARRTAGARTQAAPELPRKARARNAAGNDGGAAVQDSRRCTGVSTTRSFTRAIARRSMRHPPRWWPRRRNWPRRRKNGWSWKSCARISRRNERRSCAM